ncbi:4-carboxymuconolactone decarboxylase [Amycolatopsis sp. K13G38]|uniref:4-carboxymuconolactone decarboxylase n=1 Tax=Amycolatopsis acididurans TaxID=2724524 RepID=A0ABX1J9J5_9PSEU|nr:carboxymuconolactone decarboxylase family protein [Amycolatopsis acididurans]NKQ55569.1 4-carboxymuconolactone decarboxylase [Amycolatopsis acididurans]
MNDGQTDMFERGKRIRGEVVGREVVEKSLEAADEFTRPIQELVTEYCWGALWGRTELDRRSRSILNIGMLAVLNKPDELAGHIRGAIANGLTKVEIRECLLQVAVYAGMPAGLSATKIAQTVLAEFDG